MTFRTGARFGTAIVGSAAASIRFVAGPRAGKAYAAAASGGEADKFERSFMPKLMDHHATAIAMAELAEGAGARRELQQMAQKTISSQTEENGKLASWLSQWYGQSHSAQPDRGQLEMLQGMEGEAFERHFMEMMIAHHRAGISMAQGALEQAEHSELLQMCEMIISSQLADSEQLRGWLQQWFGVKAAA